MKTATYHPPVEPRFRGGAKDESGNALMFTVVLTGIIGLILASYLTLVQSQNGANARSQSWNSSMPVVEAGIEDAMAHLNRNGTTNGSLLSDGWIATPGGYAVTRALAEGFYTATIMNYTSGAALNSPTIESKGYVPMPRLLAGVQAGGGLPYLAAAGGSITTYLGRGVRVRTVPDFIFTKGIVARDSLDLNGNGIRTDSYDSTDPTASTNGLYSADRARDKGDIAVNSSLTNSLNVGDAMIYGHVSVGPGGSIDIGSSGSIGSTNWHLAGNTGVEGGWTKNDMNVSFPDVQAPFIGGTFTPAGGWITNTTPGGFLVATLYDYILDDGDFAKDILRGSVYVRGNARLYVTSELEIQALAMAPDKSISIYCAAPSASITGADAVNGDGTADKLAFWGLPSCTSVSLNGTASFTGTVYAPNADLTIERNSHGSGSGSVDFNGAAIARRARLRGNLQVHYDEALARRGPFRGYIARSWNEMSAADVPVLTVAMP